MSKFENAERGAVAQADLTGASLRLHFVEFVALIAALMALTALSIDIMLPALPAIGSALGVGSENDRQLIVILYMAGFAAGQLIYGPLSDRLGRRPVLLAGLAIFVAGSIAAVISSSFYALLGARVIQGLGAASPRVLALAIVRDLYSGRHMARVMSFAMMVFIVIPVFAPSIGQGLLHLGDWHLTFYALLAIGIALALWAGLRLPETAGCALGKERASSLGQSLVSVFDAITLGYGAAAGFMFGCLLAYVASAQQIFVDIFRLGTSFPIMFGAVASVMALASYANGRLVERLGMRLVSHTALVAFLMVAGLLSIAALLDVTTLPVFALLLSFAFFLFGLIAPNFYALAMETQGHNAGMASSLVGCLSTAIGAVCGGIIGHAFDGTALPLAVGFGVCSLISCAIVLAIEGPSGRLFGRTPPKPRRL